MKTAPIAAGHDEHHDHPRWKLMILLTGAGLLLLSGGSRLFRPSQAEVSAFFAMASAAVVGAPLLYEAFRGFRNEEMISTRIFMNQLIALAVTACFASGQYVAGALTGLVLICGHLLEDRGMLGVKEALDSLLRLSKAGVRRITPNGEELVDAESLRVGDRVRLRPGDGIPADGRVIAGVSTLNQAPITGEFLPVEVEPGATIYAGAVNLTGMIEMEVTWVGGETILGRVRRIIGEAQASRAPVMRLLDEYARYYAPLVLILSGFVLFFTRDINRAIAVVIVSMPCAFVLAGPAAMIAALACASRLGLLVKSVRFFEEAAHVDTVVFDKTGTLTSGKLKVVRVVPSPGFDEAGLLRLAAGVEFHSTHPVARAIIEEAKNRGVNIPDSNDVHEEHGRGIRARIDRRQALAGRQSWVEAQTGLSLPEPADAAGFSVVQVILDGRPAGYLCLGDTLRPEAPLTIATLRELGVDQIIMVTGDRQAAADAIARELTLSGNRAECLPEDKFHAVEELKKQGRQVMVVGDGVNDAPALAAGNLGVAMGAFGSEVAIKQADIALMNNDLRRLPALMALSREAMRIINQNILCGVVFIVIAVFFSAIGWIGPLAAALIHEASAFFVILNGARLLRFDDKLNA
ncbi:MAG: cation-translocating P-type ATPase [Verrucomicrobiae bacterium]|nr:cation-translocating P-type ATPase [Verrucomicrobiae bacterium]